MKLTKLEYQKKDPNRVNVYIADKFIAGLDANDVIKLDLYGGKEIGPEELTRIISDSEFGKLFNAALNFLSFRPRSEWEIRDFFRRRLRREELKSKEKQPSKSDLVENVIDKLRQIGQIDDDAFSKWFIDQRRTFKPQGLRALKYELQKKGIERKIIDRVLKAPTDDEDSAPSELDLALKALSKKSDRIIRSITGSKSQNEAKIKLQQFLLSRGFDYDTAKLAVEKLLTKEYNWE